MRHHGATVAPREEGQQAHAQAAEAAQVQSDSSQAMVGSWPTARPTGAHDHNATHNSDYQDRDHFSASLLLAFAHAATGSARCEFIQGADSCTATEIVIASRNPHGICQGISIATKATTIVAHKLNRVFRMGST